MTLGHATYQQICNRPIEGNERKYDIVDTMIKAPIFISKQTTFLLKKITFIVIQKQY